jgi:hypothetical protein
MIDGEFGALSRAELLREQSQVVTEALRSQPRPGTDVEPVIEILAMGLSRGADVLTEVPFSEHAVEVHLSVALAAANRFAEVLCVYWSRDRGRRRYSHVRMLVAAKQETPCAVGTDRI